MHGVLGSRELAESGAGQQRGYAYVGVRDVISSQRRICRCLST